jgi:hypothetical protein
MRGREHQIVNLLPELYGVLVGEISSGFLRSSQQEDPLYCNIAISMLVFRYCNSRGFMQLTRIAIPLTLGALLISAPVFAADWQPTFTPGQAVYIDPALASDKTAPVKFGAELEQDIKALHNKSGVNYYVWAVQANSATRDKPLGVAKADEAIAAWGGQPDFPNDNYALIVWARREEDPSKGGVGINVSLGLDKFEVKPLLKGRMPQNPKGAILAIAQRLADDKAEAEFDSELQSKVSNFSMFPIYVALSLMGAGVLGALALVGVKELDPDFLYKTEALSKAKEWSKAVDNATEIYLELTSDDVIKFYSSLAQSLDGDEYTVLKSLLKQANEAVNRFLCIFQAVQMQSVSLEIFVGDNQYKAAVALMTEVVCSVDFGKLPLQKTSIFGGLNDVREYKGDELLSALDAATRQVLSRWAMLKYGKNEESPTAAINAIQIEMTRREQEERDIAEAERNRQAKLEEDRLAAARTAAAAYEARAEQRRLQALFTPSSRTSTVIVDNSSTYYSGSSSSSSSPESSSNSSSSSSDSSSSSSSDWGSSGSDYSSSDSGSFGGDY